MIAPDSIAPAVRGVDIAAIMTILSLLAGAIAHHAPATAAGRRHRDRRDRPHVH